MVSHRKYDGYALYPSLLTFLLLTLNILKTMDIRSYSKQELALLYFPGSDPKTATNHLMRWITVNPKHNHIYMAMFGIYGYQSFCSFI